MEKILLQHKPNLGTQYLYFKFEEYKILII